MKSHPKDQQCPVCRKLLARAGFKMHVLMSHPEQSVVQPIPVPSSGPAQSLPASSPPPRRPSSSPPSSDKSFRAKLIEELGDL